MEDLNELIEQLRQAEGRVRHLEGVNRRVLDALDFVASLGDFQTSINPDQDASAIMAATRSNVSRILSLEVTAFMTEPQSGGELVITDCSPDDHADATAARNRFADRRWDVCVGTQSESCACGPREDFCE